MSQPFFVCQIPGRVGIKKNSKRLIANRRRLLILPSVKYVEWEKTALKAVGFVKAVRGFETFIGDVRAEFKFYFKNKQHLPDIDNMLGGPMDVLQKAGVIQNDKQIKKLISSVSVGFEPQVTIELYGMEEI